MFPCDIIDSPECMYFVAIIYPIDELSWSNKELGLFIYIPLIYDNKVFHTILSFILLQFFLH